MPMTIAKMKELVLLAAEKEKAAHNRNYEHAAALACTELQLHPDFAELVALALSGHYNDTLEWARAPTTGEKVWPNQTND